MSLDHIPEAKEIVEMQEKVRAELADAKAKKLSDELDFAIRNFFNCFYPEIEKAARANPDASSFAFRWKPSLFYAGDTERRNIKAAADLYLILVDESKLFSCTRRGYFIEAYRPDGSTFCVTVHWKGERCEQKADK